MRTVWSTDPLASRLPSLFQPNVNTCRGACAVSATHHNPRSADIAGLQTAAAAVQQAAGRSPFGGAPERFCAPTG